MKRSTWSIVGGFVLIAVGVSLLLDVLNLTSAANLIWPALFAAGSGAFIATFAASRRNWWAAIPGFVLAGLALVMVLGVFWPTAAERWGGPLFLFFIGAGFAAVFAAQTAYWWALIPAGVMITLSIVAALPSSLSGTTAPAVLFIGFGITFGALAALPVRMAGEERRHMMWPLVPAVILAGVGLMLALQALPNFLAFQFAQPLILIGAGVALFVYAYRRRHHDEITPHR